MIERKAESTLRILSGQFKAVAVVGPRQSGKTTLVKHIFPEKPYVSLENPDLQSFALEDPRGFLGQYRKGAILDEIQRCPELFAYLQELLDEYAGTGLFILTGSNNFLLQENISQSLAGRVGYLYLLLFSIAELPDKELQNVDQVLYKGGYPPIYDQPTTAELWYPNYIRTYVERDVRQLKNITNLNAFERFMKLCAGRTGQLLNKNNLAIETGVDGKTIDSWLGILESSFIIHRLYPHHKNFNKRVVKMPKLYFYDTGLACALLGIQNQEQLLFHPLKGSLFENLIINELLKSRFNKSLPNNLYFWRDNIGHEIDVIIENGNDLFPVEIKSGQTITTDYFKGINYWKKLSGDENGAVVYAGNKHQKRSSGHEVIPWSEARNLSEQSRETL